MVDEKGRLFGKINLLDLVIVLVVLAVAGLFGYKSMGRTAGGGGGPAAAVDQPMEVTFLFPALRKASVDQLKPGVKLYDSKSADKPLLGSIVDVSSKPTIITAMSGEVESRDKVDLYVTVRGTGNVTDKSVSLGPIDMKVGRLYDMIAARWAGSGTAWTIDDHPPKREGQ